MASKIFHQESGSGFPVVLIHGFCETNEIWNTFRHKLSKNFRVLCPDLPGFGKSELLTYTTLKGVADSIYDWLVDLNVSDCIIIGHSLGGYVTLELAANHSDLMRGFGLFHSTAYTDSEEKKQSRLRTVDFVVKHGMDKFIKTFVPSLFYQLDKAALDKALSIAVQTSPEAHQAYLLAMKDRPDRMHVIKEFEKPILFIAGDKDLAVPFSQSKSQVELMQKPEAHFLKDTGHMGMYERPKETLEMVRNFVEKLAQ